MKWIQEVKNQHKKFNFSKQPPPLQEKKRTLPDDIPVSPLFKEEQDKIKQMIKRILYAEGDAIELLDDSVDYLKTAL